MKKAIVVDDQSTIANILQETLEDSGYKADAVSTVKDLLDKLQNNEYDLIVSDQNISDARGSDILKAIPNLKSAILISGDIEAGKHAVKMKIPFLLKPFSLQEFKEKLAKIDASSQ